jgi:hypothetical protein
MDFSLIDANEAVAGDQAFTFIGSAAFTEGAAQGQMRFDAATHYLYASVDADAQAEFQLLLVGVTTLSADDMVL